jgi:hypothetical protein
MQNSSILAKHKFAVSNNQVDPQPDLLKEIRSLHQKFDQVQATQAAILAHLKHGG